MIPTTDKIVLLGDDNLERSAEPVTRFDSALRNLVDRMYETMHAAQGVGLAAPQVGVGLRVAVIQIDGFDPVALVNPRIVHTEGEQTGEEGCLSIPGFSEQITRHLSVRVTAQSKQGHEFTIEREGLFARALQHEIDHLDGKLYIRLLNATRERVIRRQFRRAVKVKQ